MPINVFGNIFSSYNNGQIIDTNNFVQKSCLRTNHLENNIEEDIDVKNQHRVKNLPDPISIREAASKNYIDNKFNDLNILKKQQTTYTHRPE